MISNLIDQRIATILPDLTRYKYATSSEIVAFLYLCAKADLQQRVLVHYGQMAIRLGRRKPQTCRAYVRKLVRLGLVSVSEDHGKWASLVINLSANVIESATKFADQIPPPADA